jgi:hypothetical protein
MRQGSTPYGGRRLNGGSVYESPSGPVRVAIKHMENNEKFAFKESDDLLSSHLKEAGEMRYAKVRFLDPQGREPDPMVMPSPEQMVEIKARGLMELFEASNEECVSELRDTVAPNEDTFNQAVDELRLWANALMDGYLRPEDVAGGLGFIQITPFRPIAVEDIYAHMGTLGLKEEADAMRAFLASARKNPDFALSVPHSARPS